MVNRHSLLRELFRQEDYEEDSCRCAALGYIKAITLEDILRQQKKVAGSSPKETIRQRDG